MTIGPDGRVRNVHRKLTPTVGERLVHAPGDASGLRAVDTDVGRIGGRICGESSNPLSLFTLTAESVQILVISWPDFPGRAMMPRAERALVAGRGAAFMTRAYVLNAVGRQHAQPPTAVTVVLGVFGCNDLVDAAMGS